MEEIQLHITSDGTPEGTIVTAEGKKLAGLMSFAWSVDPLGNPTAHLAFTGCKVDICHHPQIVDINDYQTVGSLEELKAMHERLGERIKEMEKQPFPEDCCKGGQVTDECAQNEDCERRDVTVEAPVATPYQPQDYNPHSGKVEPVVSMLLPEETPPPSPQP